MKRVLAISPHFPPLNAADMHRLRMSLPYFNKFGWEVEVACVDEKYSEIIEDPLLLNSLPNGQVVHKVSAFDKNWTAKLGLGSLALRSMWFYLHAVSRLLSRRHYDLIYFTTTQFPVTVLGRYWKHKFGVPYVIDMQDPWHSDYYRGKPKHQQPAKYWFSYRLNKWLEPIALKEADGLISVSESYITTLKTRYPAIKGVPAATITFGYSEADMAIAVSRQGSFRQVLVPGKVNVVYAGRGGADMHRAVKLVFEAFKEGLIKNRALFSRLQFYFIGTSYAPAGAGAPSISPLAAELGIAAYVTELTDRISYYHTLALLQQADALFIPGSDDAGYTASKLYPYMLARKPLLAVFHPASSALGILNGCTSGPVALSIQDNREEMLGNIYQLLADWASEKWNPTELMQGVEAFNSEKLTGEQARLFDQVLRQRLTTPGFLQNKTTDKNCL